ncbi:UNKNOWN [Stylonychia lemnae]|uniref:Uncharacterized protein n=1 Tax=Stylonychia lemnae TaxID=5949 RepID=A0A077ZM50_STYLE|nr:UNKNOWN [Stylonychia lemnae]|eukprot:CDW71063.1 UNKNOWN [Stylonychia lemnae]
MDLYQVQQLSERLQSIFRGARSPRNETQNAKSLLSNNYLTEGLTSNLSPRESMQFKDKRRIIQKSPDLKQRSLMYMQNISWWTRIEEHFISSEQRDYYCLDLFERFLTYMRISLSKKEQRKIDLKHPIKCLVCIARKSNNKEQLYRQLYGNLNKANPEILKFMMCTIDQNLFKNYMDLDNDMMNIYEFYYFNMNQGTNKEFYRRFYNSILVTTNILFQRLPEIMLEYIKYEKELGSNILLRNLYLIICIIMIKMKQNRRLINNFEKSSILGNLFIFFSNDHHFLKEELPRPWQVQLKYQNLNEEGTLLFCKSSNMPYWLDTVYAACA